MSYLQSIIISQFAISSSTLTNSRLFLIFIFFWLCLHFGISAEHLFWIRSLARLTVWNACAQFLSPPSTARLHQLHNQSQNIAHFGFTNFLLIKPNSNVKNVFTRNLLTPGKCFATSFLINFGYSKIRNFLAERM